MLMLFSSNRAFSFSLRGRRLCHVVFSEPSNRHFSATAVSTLLSLSSSDISTLLDPVSFAKSSNDKEASHLIPYPKSLSPSSISEFKKCPQSFLLQYLWKLKQPTNPILTKGIMCHSALEKLFDLDPPDRTLENLHNLLRAVWSEHRKIEPYDTLFESIEDERNWGIEGLRLLQNYVEMEDPRHINRPYRREAWVRANLSVDPEKGVTYSPLSPLYRNDDSTATTDQKNDTFLVRGIVDRVDVIPSDLTGEEALRIVDYKTGKAPHLKYSPRMNDKILNESMEQLKIYALLLRESKKESNDYKNIRFLRLFYLKSPLRSDRAHIIDYDLGKSQTIRDEKLQLIHQDLTNVWNHINELVNTQDPLQFKPCSRSFCYCHKCRKQFIPGALAEPSSTLKP